MHAFSCDQTHYRWLHPSGAGTPCHDVTPCMHALRGQATSMWLSMALCTAAGTISSALQAGRGAHALAVHRYRQTRHGRAEERHPASVVERSCIHAWLPGQRFRQLCAMQRSWAPRTATPITHDGVCAITQHSSMCEPRHSKHSGASCIALEARKEVPAYVHIGIAYESRNQRQHRPPGKETERPYTLTTVPATGRVRHKHA